MKCEFEVNVLSTRPYVFTDKDSGVKTEMTEIVYQDDEGQLYKSSKRGIVTRTGKTVIVINIRPGAVLKPEVGVIEF